MGSGCAVLERPWTPNTGGFLIHLKTQQDSVALFQAILNAKLVGQIFAFYH
jgi:hypothetical protein